MTVAAGTIGHTFGVKVQRVHKVQRVQRVMVAPCGRIIKMALEAPYLANWSGD